MAVQLLLIQNLPVQRKYETKNEKFLAFHALNPQVYDGLVKLATEYRVKFPGHKIGIDALYEVLRWGYLHTGFIKSFDEYRLNHNYRSRYARLIMRQEPFLAGIFDTRKLRGGE
jgi:hypothetical protein